MATKRKTTTGIVAGVTAVALLLGGTFAWTSISQQAKNETAGIVNVGGRLHDDFDGENKDVYVENFTDPLNGGQPIYARVRLDEYMEVGKDAGGTDVDGDGNIDAVPVITGTDRDNVKTWKPHVPADACEECDSGDTCVIHEHWTWTMGGVEGDGSTIFMPTFNKDKDSLAADINGTYAGTDENDKIYYDDYVEYTTDETSGVVNEADKEAYDGKIYSIIGTEIYDNDTDTEDNGGVREVAGVTHTAKQTSTGSVVLMENWNKTPGNYWVYDTDGWAYWANPIMPGEATGLLLDGIEMTSNPGEKCYYAINVVAQFATVGDWEYFDGTEENGTFDGTDAAKTLLETVSKNVTVVTVTNNGATTLSTVVDEEAGITNTTTFTATAAKVGDSTATAADAEFTWAVYDADLNPVTTSTITVENGIATLTIGENEQNKNLIIAATHTESGAVGLSSVAIDTPVVTYRLAVNRNDTSEEPYNDIGNLILSETASTNYTVTLMKNDKPLSISQVVSVEVVDKASTSVTQLQTFAGSATLQDDGTVLLTVGTQDAELGTSTEPVQGFYWKIIRLTVKDSEDIEYSRCLFINTLGMTFKDIIFRNMDGSLITNIGNYVITSNLTSNTLYTFEPGLNAGSNGTWNKHLDSVWFDDGYTVKAYEYDSASSSVGTEVTSVTIKDNTIIFTEAGQFVIRAEKDGEIVESHSITVTDGSAT